MSHIVSIETEIRDREALTAACRRLGLPRPVAGTARLFSGKAAGLIVKLPGWRYPVAVDTQAGKIHYDNYQGRWGDRQQLDKLRQAYAVEKTCLEARKAGHSVVEQELSDGSIKLVIQVGGAP